MRIDLISKIVQLALNMGLLQMLLFDDRLFVFVEKVNSLIQSQNCNTHKNGGHSTLEEGCAAQFLYLKDAIKAVDD